MIEWTDNDSRLGRQYVQHNSKQWADDHGIEYQWVGWQSLILPLYECSNELADNSITWHQLVSQQWCNLMLMIGPTIVFHSINGSDDSDGTWCQWVGRQWYYSLPMGGLTVIQLNANEWADNGIIHCPWVGWQWYLNANEWADSDITQSQWVGRQWYYSLPMGGPTVIQLNANEWADNGIVHYQLVGWQWYNSMPMGGPTMVLFITNGWADSQMTQKTVATWYGYSYQMVGPTVASPWVYLYHTAGPTLVWPIVNRLAHDQVSPLRWLGRHSYSMIGPAIPDVVTQLGRPTIGWPVRYGDLSPSAVSLEMDLSHWSMWSTWLSMWRTI
jgi:hypothetical protein